MASARGTLPETSCMFPRRRNMADMYVDRIRQLVETDCKTYQEVSAILQKSTGWTRGFSARTIRRLCAEHGIRTRGKQLVPDAELEAHVTAAIHETGPAYGRKMMTGYLASKGVHAAETRVGRALRQVNAPYHVRRVQGAKNLNPIPYHAEYFGHKLHMDQNEKLVMFGATHVVAIDGYSGKVVAWTTMPVKNNCKIYDEVYRSAVLQNGMWDQVRVDHGTEFYLSLYMQERNQALRYNTNRQPYIQTQSKQNHKVERIWPEVNQRVNYPIKRALVELLDQDALDMDNDLVRYCTSQLTLTLARLGIKRVVDAWNAHRIPGRGIPNQLASNSCAKSVSETDLPPASQAVIMYETDLGNRLSAESTFGRDPFPTDAARNACQVDFQNQHNDMEFLFNKTVNEEFGHFQAALMTLIRLTRQYSGIH